MNLGDKQPVTFGVCMGYKAEALKVSVQLPPVKCLPACAFIGYDLKRQTPAV
jgi:hypothetical protein